MRSGRRRRLHRHRLRRPRPSKASSNSPSRGTPTATESWVLWRSSSTQSSCSRSPARRLPCRQAWSSTTSCGSSPPWQGPGARGEPSHRHYLAGHFAASTAGMVLFFFVAASIIFLIQQRLPTWVAPWLYPIAVAGVPLTIISMGMTWQGLRARKLGSFALALVMPLLALFLLIGQVPLTTPEGRYLFEVMFLIGALTTEFSGSLLHIIASSTSVYQREILKADNTKLAMVQQDYERKREALDYKERALRGREAHLEALQQELEDQARELKAKITDVTGREVAVEKATKELRDIDRKVASARAEIEAKVEELRLRDADLTTVKTELEKTKQALGAREASLAEREKEVKRTSIEITSKVRASEAKLKSIEVRLTS